MKRNKKKNNNKLSGKMKKKKSLGKKKGSIYMAVRVKTVILIRVHRLYTSTPSYNVYTRGEV